MIRLTEVQWCFVFLSMFFLHIADDYYLQGILASLKQKDWWKNQKGYNNMYQNDYIPALLAHSFSWSCMINLPFIILTHGNSTLVILMIGINWVIHCVVDDLKANRKKINLCVDQSIHMGQIIVTFIVCYLNFN